MVTGLGVLKAKLFKGRYEPKSKFPEGWWIETKKKNIKPSVRGRRRIFSGTTHCN